MTLHGGDIFSKCLHDGTSALGRWCWIGVFWHTMSFCIIFIYGYRRSVHTNERLLFVPKLPSIEACVNELDENNGHRQRQVRND
jgi:hypothetical protein